MLTYNYLTCNFLRIFGEGGCIVKAQYNNLVCTVSLKRTSKSYNIFCPFYQKKSKLKVLTMLKRKYLLCCPVLKPQMTGLPRFPGEFRVKVSDTQSPMEPPIGKLNGIFHIISVKCNTKFLN